jgi:hypothetical protein
MEQKDIIGDGARELDFKDCFVKNGRLTPQRDEEGASKGLVISANFQNPLKIVCPYCEGADNILERKDAKPIFGNDVYTGELHELTFHGFRCASCLRPWVMLISNKGGAVSIGYNE